jgi:hypothetical protein
MIWYLFVTAPGYLLSHLQNCCSLGARIGFSLGARIVFSVGATWIFIVVAHCNKHLQVNMLPHSDTLFWSEPTSLCFHLMLVRSGGTQNANYIFFYLIWRRERLMIWYLFVTCTGLLTITPTKLLFIRS